MPAARTVRYRTCLHEYQNHGLDASMQVVYAAKTAGSAPGEFLGQPNRTVRELRVKW